MGCRGVGVGRGEGTHFVRIGKKALKLDTVSYCEARIWQDDMSRKVYFAGSANNTPLVFSEADAKELWKYLDYVAEKPASRLHFLNSLIVCFASLFDPYRRLRPMSFLRDP